MKRYLLHILLFFALVAVVDVIVGFGGDYLQAHAIGGYTGLTNDFAQKDTHDVLVLGSSRAKHHYDTHFLSDTLGVDVYNAGYEGCGVILANGLLELVLDRYKPKLVIFDVAYSFDIIDNPNDNNNVRYIKWLKPYYKTANVGKIIKDVSMEEWYKVHSGLIRYNSVLLNELNDNINARKFGINGYEPSNGVLPDSVNIVIDSSEHRVDLLKLKYIERLIHLSQSKGVPVVFVKSPRFGYTDSEIINPVKEICQRNNVPFYDYRCREELQRPYYFCDQSHLNAQGALFFSRMLVSETNIKDLINSN